MGVEKASKKMLDIFAFERRPTKRDDAETLFEAAQYIFSLLLRSIIDAPSTGATYANVINQMLAKAATDGKPLAYRNFIRNQFSLREVVVSPTPLSEDLEEGLELAPDVEDAEDAQQDRRGCCGTMLLSEYTGDEEAIESERKDLVKYLLKVEKQTPTRTAPKAQKQPATE